MKKKYISLYLFVLLFFTIKNTFAFSIIRDAQSEEFLQNILNRILVANKIKKDSIKPLIVVDNSINAFVTNQKYMFINTGLILALQTPEQIASIMAHELGHIQLGHNILRQHNKNKSLIKSLLMAVASATITIASKDSRGIPTSIKAAAAMYTESMIGYTQVQEQQADSFAINALKVANIPLKSFIDSFNILYEQTKYIEKQIPKEFLDHPPTQERIKIIKQNINQTKQINKLGFNNNIHKQLIEVKYKIISFLGKINKHKQILEQADNSYKPYINSIFLYRKGQIKKSLLILKSFINTHPNNPYLYELAGQISAEYGMYKTAYTAYYKAYKMLSNNPFIITSYANVLLKINNNKNYIQIKKMLEKALLTEQKSAIIWNTYGLVLAKLNKKGLAQLAFATQAILEARPKDAKILAEKAKKSFIKKSSNWIKANDIINSSKNYYN